MSEPKMRITEKPISGRGDGTEVRLVPWAELRAVVNQNVSRTWIQLAAALCGHCRLSASRRGPFQPPAPGGGSSPPGHKNPFTALHLRRGSPHLLPFKKRYTDFAPGGLL